MSIANPKLQLRSGRLRRGTCRLAPGQGPNRSAPRPVIPSPMGPKGASLGQRRPARRAALTVELILTLPIFLILLVAVVQFGLYHVRMQHVALASRIGAQQAAQIANLQSYPSVPSQVTSAVGAHLQSVGINTFCIRLEHNDGVSPPNPPVVLWEPLSGCSGCTISSLSSSPYSGTEYVRVSICVPLTELMPNVLKVFGFDLTGKHTAFTTVYRYEQ